MNAKFGVNAAVKQNNMKSPEKLKDAFKEIKKAEAELQDVKADVKAEVSRVWSWNPDKISWLEAQGAKGEFERSEDQDNPEFKAMLKDLANHNGRLTRDGYFYWVYKNGATVGRKSVKGLEWGLPTKAGFQAKGANLWGWALSLMACTCDIFTIKFLNSL